MLVACRECQTRLDVPQDALGRIVSCPKCGAGAIAPVTNEPGRVTLTIIDGKLKGFSLTLGDLCTLGRDSKNTCQILDDRISRHHAIIQKQGDHHVFRDMGSLNGSWLNDEKVTADQELRDGDRIRMGDHTLLVNVERANETQPGRQVPRPSIPGKPRAFLTVVEEAYDSALIQAELDAREEPSSIQRIEVEEDLETVKRAYKKLSLAFTLHDQLTNITDLDLVLKKILEILFDIFPADRGVVLLEDEDGNSFVPRVSRLREKADVGAEIRVSKTLLTYVQQRGKAILIQDAQKTVGTESILLENVASAMSVPLFLKEKLKGILHVDCLGGDGKVFSAKDLDILTGIGNQIAIAIDNVRLNQEIERKTKLTANLSRYLAPELVEQLTNHGVDLQKMGGETKKITVLFSDIRGFTSLSETMEPKDVVALLNDYFEIMVECIFKFGGTLDKFIGDAIMAVWGSLIPDPLGAFNAIQCALEMQTELAHFNLLREREGKVAVHMGIGINTGPALAGDLGSPKRREYTVIGDTVNLASRIEHMTSAGQIIVSENTASDVSGYLRAEPLDPAQVKGKARPVLPYLVRGIYSSVNPDQERRRHPRMKVCIPAEVTNEARSFSQTGLIDDITNDSLSVQVSLASGNEFTVDDGVALRFRLSSDSPEITARGAVSGVRYLLKTRGQVHHRVVVTVGVVGAECASLIRDFLTVGSPAQAGGATPPACEPEAPRT